MSVYQIYVFIILYIDKFKYLLVLPVQFTPLLDLGVIVIFRSLMELIILSRYCHNYSSDI